MVDRPTLPELANGEPSAELPQLIARHLDWVYSLCRRSVRDAELAEDVTQDVFLILIKKAARLPHGASMSGWIFNTVCYCCNNAVRNQRTRRRHELAATQMRSEPAATEAPMRDEELIPLLDEQIARLSKADRTALLLRYYECRSLREVGDVLGISEEAAKKRVQRAVEKLRTRMTRKLIPLGAEALTAILADKLVQPAPAKLTAAILAHASHEAVATAAATSQSKMLAKASVEAMSSGKIAIAIAGIVLTLGLIAEGVAKTLADHSQGRLLAPPVTVVNGPSAHAQSTSAEFHVPKIISRTAAALDNPGHPSHELVMRTFQVLEQTMAAVNPQRQHQSPRFHQLLNALVLDVNAGGLPPGFLWERFLEQSRINGFNALPGVVIFQGQGGASVSFQTGDYTEMLVWAQSYFKRTAHRNPGLLDQYGKAMIRLDMEDLFLTFWVTGVGSYNEKYLLARKQREYLFSSPSVWVIAHNANLRHLFRSYYHGASRVNGYHVMTPTLKPMQALLDRRDGRLPRVDVTHVLAGFTGLRRVIGKEQYYSRWRLAHLLWRFLCLAHARKDQPAALQIKTYIRSWANHTKRWYLRRWLSQALTTPGPVPQFFWGPPVELTPVHKR
ncbi:MAG: RNA polymerase sigma factor [Phycisphaerae bacterium]